ncbi:hypothetical protein ACFPIJ_04705 [Dactylosporangium cerinum]|uniref:Uncharacterized protein n=1 Tax=Dactylosporangium cerinum TaxID=1434730 RepID=A0ABV9VQ69_9ACTN
MAATYGLLSTHPPTRCGLAFFHGVIAAHRTTAGRKGRLVRVTAVGDDPRPGVGVAHTWSAGSITGVAAQYETLAAALITAAAAGHGHAARATGSRS